MGGTHCSFPMVAIVERSYHQAPLRLSPLAQVVQNLMCHRLRILICPRPTVDMKEHHSVLCLLGCQLVDPIQVHRKPRDIDGRAA